MQTASPSTSQYRDIIVIGGSAGGIEALRQLVGQFPPDLPATICVVIHTSPSDPGLLAPILDRTSALPARIALDDEPLVAGRIYVAAPDQHLMVYPTFLRLSRGPRENRARPAIDPLFRSAATAFGERVIGVLLSGLLDDGTSGLAAIKRCGGITIAQDPADAAYGDMPQSAIDAGVVDYHVPVAEIGALIHQLMRVPISQIHDVPADIATEVRIAGRAMSNIPDEERLGELAPFGCPECGGPMWQLDDQTVRRYRCHVGHGYTARSLMDEQKQTAERSLWIALRTMEERANLLRNIAREQHQRGHMLVAQRYQDEAQEVHDAAQTISRMLNHS